MYSRSYDSTEEREVSIPLHYDGVAFGDVSTAAEEDRAEDEDVKASAPPAERGFGLNLPFLKGILSPAALGGVRMPKIGKEEIILLTAAAFLFFTNSGDKECAIMLLLLVFLT